MIFSYKAKEGPHKIVQGTIDASTREQAISEIIKKKLIPLEVNADERQKSEVPLTKHSDTKGRGRLFFKSIRLSDQVLFTRQMSDLIGASVPILKALQTVANQTHNPLFAARLQQMNEIVRDGGSFSDALSKHKDVFSPLYISMVKTGELSGNLEMILERLAGFLESEQEVRGKITSSLAYPGFILGFGILSLFILLTWVFPLLSSVFEDLNQQLPLPTIILTKTSKFFASYWWLIILILGGMGFYFWKWIHTDKGRRKIDETILRLPILGSYIRFVEIGRFSRTLGTLLDSGVTITSSLSSVALIVQNVVLKEEILKVANMVENGSSFKSALEQCSFFPEMAYNMISVGESAGHMEKALYKIADTYEKQSDRMMKTVLSLLGPLVLVFIVSIIGFMVIAMLLPIFKMNTLVQ